MHVSLKTLTLTAGSIIYLVQVINMKKKRITQLIVAIISIGALAAGRPMSVPDARANLHGLPLTWGVHQLVTIAGPVDTWSVNLVNLVIDLAIWFIIFLAIPLILKDS